MSRRFLFSIKAPTGVQTVLKSLAAVEFIQATTCIVVVTDDDQVAALLDKLETSERILTPGEQELIVADVRQKRLPVMDTSKMRKPRRQYSGPLFECPNCHEKKAPGHMTKAGLCKVCHMRELRAAKANKDVGAQTSKKSRSGMPGKSDYGHEENLIKYSGS